ncbi:MAG: hypothetical protein CMJ65_07740 [Planctomycetaceae bacterium]|nr:hypothetical protein [Planctomycetaceae bacterium]
MIYQRESVVSQMPVTTWRTQWVDQGQYRMVWVPRVVARQVPQTTYHQQFGYRIVPYQRMTPSTAASNASAGPASTTGDHRSASTATTNGQVPDPLEVQPVTTRRRVDARLRPTTAQRVWQVRGRLGR